MRDEMDFRSGSVAYQNSGDSCYNIKAHSYSYPAHKKARAFYRAGLG